VTVTFKEFIMKNKLFCIALAAIVVFVFFACGGGGSGKTFNDVQKVEDWLAKQKGGGSPDDPIPFSVKQNLQNMASPESNWQKLLASINTAGLYVALDLSGSTMPTTVFDADGGTNTGKQFIVSLVLPDSTESVNGVLFAHFSNLKTVKSRKSEFFIGSPGPGGGIVFFDKGEFSEGWRYLEAAPADMENRLRWVAQSYGDNRRNFPNVAGTSEKIGTGRQNTALILAADADAPAAKACADYRGGGFSDWYLPSRDELNRMYQNLKRNNIGGFSNYIYWSSSQYLDSYLGDRGAWTQNFASGYQYFDYKHVGNRVRGVRAF
jgi:hypothetical protein